MILPNQPSMNGNTTYTACNKMIQTFIDIIPNIISGIINYINHSNILPYIDNDSSVGPGLTTKSKAASDTDDNYDYIPLDLR